MKHGILYFILILGFVSCKNETEEYTLKIEDKINFIGHKGSGTYGEQGNLEWRDNSITAILNALKILQGAEFDVQLSKNKTLWIYHDHLIRNNKDSLVNIGTLSDIELREISKQNYFNQLDSLGSLMIEMKKFDFKTKTISLDLKVLQNDNAINLFGNRDSLAAYVANQLNKYRNHQSGIKILVEVPYIDQYEVFKKRTAFQTYLLITKSDSIKNKNFPISTTLDIFSSFINKKEPHFFQLWTINTVDDMLRALPFAPDYIQSDNIALSKFFIDMRKRKAISRLIETKKEMPRSQEEFYLIKKIALNNSGQNYILNFESEEINCSQELLLVFSSSNKKNETIYWTAYKLSSKKPVNEFINEEYILKKGGKELFVYVYNPPKAIFEMKGCKLKKIELTEDEKK